MNHRFGWVLLIICCLLAGCGRPLPEQTYLPELPEDTVAQTEIPETEPPVTAPTEVAQMPEPAEDQLVRVTAYIPLVREELAYATGDNFTGEQIYNFSEAYLRYGTVKKLSGVCGELEKQGLGLLIWDAFRPLWAQQKLWDICPDPSFVSHPVTGSRSHCRGSAVDVTLVDLKTGEKLEMPTDFDDFSSYADRDYSDCTEEASNNARLLEQIMSEYGFKPYSGEWWHFSDLDDYPVEESFTPEQTLFTGGVG